MSKTVYVHIGAPAAGAAFLQRKLEANRDTLRDAGIDLLDPWPWSTYKTSGLDDHAELAWDRVAASVLASDCQTVVMSDESLAGASADQVARGLASLADHRVQVIYGIPDFGHALISEWQRHIIETSRAISPATWIDELVSGQHPAFWRTYDLDDVFGRWTVPPRRCTRGRRSFRSR